MSSTESASSHPMHHSGRLAGKDQCRTRHARMGLLFVLLVLPSITYALYEALFTES
jgi:hypothetical protein